MMSSTIAKRWTIGLIFLILPIILITSWFQYDDDISYGYGFFYFWVTTLGYLLLFELAWFIKSLIRKKNNLDNKVENRLLFIGFVLFLIGAFYFIANFD